MTRVLVTAPARQEPKIFDLYRESVDNLILPDNVSVDTFYVVNNCPELIPHLRPSDQYIVSDTDQQYYKTHNDHIWTSENIQTVAFLRNLTIRYALEHNYDYWFSIDTDLVLHPLTLQTLLQADKDIVSEIFWTDDKNGNPWCNAWLHDNGSGMLQEWHRPGLYPCGMTGALTLVKRQVLEAGVDYTFIPNIRKALWGEDRHFCVRAAVHGFELWVDTHYPATHLYTELVYQQYIKERNDQNEK